MKTSAGHKCKQKQRQLQESSFSFLIGIQVYFGVPEAGTHRSAPPLTKSAVDEDQK